MGDVIRRVKLLNLEEGDKIRYRSRSIVIETKDGTITHRWRAPVRVQNQQYLAAKATIPSEVPIFSPMGIAHLKLGPDRLQNLLTSNENAKKRFNNLRKIYATFIHFPIRSLFLEPTIEGRKYLGKKIEMANRYVNLAMRFASQIGFNSVLMPFFDSPPQDWLKMFNDIIGEYGVRIQVIPVLPINMKAPVLEGLIKRIKTNFIETDTIKMIGFIYTNYRTAPISHEIIWENLKDENVAILLTGVERRLPSMYDLSGPHYESFIIGDLFSPKLTRYTPPEKAKATVEYRLRFFSRSQLTVDEFLDVLVEGRRDILIEELKGVYSANYEEMVEEAILNYKEAERDDKKYKILDAISKVHETVMSNKEFEIMGKNVEKGETEEYIKQKEVLRRSLEKSLPQKLNRYF